MTRTAPIPSFLDSPIRFAVLALIGIGGFAFGVAGLLELERSPNASTAWLNAIYHGLQLFLLDGHYHKEAIPWTLQLGRFLCGFTTIATVISVVFTMLSTNLRGILTRILGGHILIIGPGDLASAVAKHARADRKRVVLATTRSTASKWRTEVGSHFSILAGKTDSVSFLRRCQAKRASRILIVGDDDADNLAAAAALEEIVASRKGQERKVLISNADARASLDAGSSFLKHIDVVSLNFEERRARKFFEDHPLDFEQLPMASSSHAAKGATLIVLGSGCFSKQLLLQAGRIGHFASGVKTRVLWIAPDVQQESQGILRRSPALEEVLLISRAEFCAGDPGLRTLLREEVGRAAKLEEPVTVAIVEGKQVSDRMGAALWVQELLPPGISHVSIVPDLGSSAELGRLVATKAFQLDHANVRAFNSPILEETLDLELSDSVDALAKGFHEQYCASRVRSRIVDAADPIRPAEKDWKYLEETYRASTRALADHLPIKLRAIGCEVGKCKKGAEPARIELSDSDVEMLAKVEHERWCAERLLAGWVYRPKRDDQLLHHNLLVKWEELSEADRYLDRDVVKGAVKALSPSHQIVRKTQLSWS